MSKETREIISSLMDGEVSREATRFLVRRVGSDEELHATWARYHVVRDCIRSKGSLYAQGDLCQRVRQAIENEERPRGSIRRVPAWLKPLGGAAIAASVALVAVLAVNPAGAPTIEGSSELAGSTGTESFSNPRSMSATPVVSRTVSQSSMDPYLMRHYQVSGAGHVRAFPAYISMIAVSGRPVQSDTSGTVPEDSGADENAKPGEE